MKGQFSIKSCRHGLSTFKVTGRVNGKRITHFFRTRAEAQVECERRNIELIHYGHSMAAMPATLRVEALTCSERLAMIGATLTNATDYYFEVHDRRAKSVPVQFAFNQCKLDLERRVIANEISAAHLETVVKAGKKLAAAFGEKHICDLDNQSLEQWITQLPLAATTRNNVRINLSSIFSFAIKRGWIEQNPISKIKSFNTHRLKSKLPGIVTPQEAALLLEHAEAEIVPFFAIGLFAGLRVAELERLDWSEINWGKRLINVVAEKTKTAQPRWVPMTDNLVAWLTPYRRAHGPVAPNGSALDRIIVQSRKAAGITWGHGKANALRHSFCSYHLALHEDAALTAGRAGHMGTAMLYKHYNHRVEKSEAEKYFSIAPAAEAQNILAIA